MAKKNPFENLPGLDESNYLTIRVEQLKSKSLPDDFNAAIDDLTDIRDNLLVAQRAGSIANIGGRTWYMDTLQWLRGQTALNLWIGVPQVTDLNAIDSNTASLFHQHTQQLTNNLRNDGNFSQIMVARASSDAITRQNIVKARDEVADEYERQMESKISEAEHRLQQQSTTIQEGFNQQTENARATIQASVDTATSQIQQARVLESWGAEYEAEVGELEKKLHGQRLSAGTLARNLHSLKRHMKVFVRSFAWDGNKTPITNLLRALLTALRGTATGILIAARNIFVISRIAWSQLTSFSARRSITFTLLTLFALVFVAFAFITSHEIKSVWGFDTSVFINQSSSDYIAKLAVYLPIVILLGIAYSFAVKNYRIYANMLDQYRHRKVVANTSKGIILSLRDEADTDVRNGVAAAAAQALFEHRNTGHLSKKEAESLSVLEIFRSMRP